MSLKTSDKYRKSVEDVTKSETKREKMMSQTQGNSTDDAVSLSHGRFLFDTRRHSLSCLMMKFHGI